MHYYRLVDDKSASTRWSLGSVRRVGDHSFDPRAFLECRSMGSAGDYEVSQSREGKPLDFTLAAFDVPVLSAAFVEPLAAEIGDAVEWLPLSVAGARRSYVVLNSVTCVDCLDHEQSGVSYWTPPGESEPRLLSVVDLKIDPSRVRGRHVFRLKDWRIALVVSETVRSTLATAQGACFVRV